MIDRHDDALVTIQRHYSVDWIQVEHVRHELLAELTRIPHIKTSLGTASVRGIEPSHDCVVEHDVIVSAVNVFLDAIVMQSSASLVIPEWALMRLPHLASALGLTLEVLFGLIE